MDEIKSAREIAAEKAARIGEATEAERLRWKYLPEGEKLALRYLQEDAKLAPELGKYDRKAQKYIAEGISSVLIRNIGLPDSDLAKKNNRQAMEGLKLVKTDQVGVENVLSKIRRIFEHYAGQGDQQRKQAYESLKAEFEAQVRQALQQQLGAFGRFQVDVEKQPQFQAEWRRRQGQLDSQYHALLNELKQELSALS
jgi:hypothetical protein